MKTKSKIIVLLAGAAVSATALASAYAQNAGGNQPAQPNMENCQPGTPGQGPCGEGMSPQGNGPQANGPQGTGPQAMNGRGMDRDRDGHGMRNGKWGRQMASGEHGRRGPGQQGMGQRGMDRGGMDRRGMGQQGPNLIFQRADKDNSGTVTFEEFEAVQPLQIAGADANSDGNINLDELTNAMLRDAMKRRAEQVIKRFDTNNDGQISTAELQEHEKRIFARLDVDGSGVIEQDELRAPRGDMRGRGPGGDGPRGGQGARGQYRMNNN